MFLALTVAYKILVRKHERKRPLGRPKCRWEDKSECILGK